MCREDLADARDDHVLRDVPLVGRLQVEHDVKVVAALGAGQVGDSRDAFLPPDFVDHLLRDRRRALERGALRRVDVGGELAHVLARDERAADHAVQRDGRGRARPPVMPRMVIGWASAHSSDARSTPVDPVEEAAVLGLAGRARRRPASGTARSASA